MSTNSITQGEQVQLLFPQIFSNGFKISFAYKSFKWESESRGTAQVTVVIIGLSNSDHNKRLFEYDNELLVETNPNNISAYLRDTENNNPIIVYDSSRPLNGLPELRVGSQPIDDGNYIFTQEQRNEFIQLEPDAEKFMKSFVNAKNFINGHVYYILELQDILPNELRRLPHVLNRVNAVREFRLSSKREETKKLADTPTLYAHTRIPDSPFLLIPRVSSEKRDYIPIGYITPPSIPSDATMIVENASLGLFGLLISNMHMVWLRSVGGKLETRVRYSGSMVYNTFPIPDDTLDSLSPFAEKILETREKYSDSTLEDLYDPITMPTDLKEAHKKLDKTVDKLYRTESFESDDERREFLLEKYQEMIGTQTTL